MKIDAPRLLVSDPNNNIFSIPYLEAVGSSAFHYFRLSPSELIKLPPNSQLFVLPDRSPVGYDHSSNNFTAIKRDALFAVGAFISPGYTITHTSSYLEIGHPRTLPLYSYGAAAFYKGEIYVAAIRVECDRRHDSRFIDICEVKRDIAKMRKLFSRNRLIGQLETCALKYNCPNAQNFFLGRYEGPLPSSPFCNAACAACISYQSSNMLPSSQNRIKFIPRPEEIRDLALYHIKRARNPIVSFGQGCDGEPLLVGKILAKAINMIRQNTTKGTININTNGSLPLEVSRLFDAGLDSIRVSLNSARDKYYARYYNPRGYAFKDVLRSFEIGRKRGGFISINYLTMPGFSDSKDEFAALNNLIEKYSINMIQWRNLNADPAWYFGIINACPKRADLIGVKNVIRRLKKRFPKLLMGYFNPSRRMMKNERI